MKLYKDDNHPSVVIRSSKPIHSFASHSYEPSYLVLCLIMRAMYYCFAIQVLDRRSFTTLFVFTFDLVLSSWPFAIGFSLFLQIARETMLFYYPKTMEFEIENVFFTVTAFLVSIFYCLPLRRRRKTLPLHSNEKEN